MRRALNLSKRNLSCTTESIQNHESFIQRRIGVLYDAEDSKDYVKCYNNTQVSGEKDKTDKV